MSLAFLSPPPIMGFGDTMKKRTVIRGLLGIGLLFTFALLGPPLGQAQTSAVVSLPNISVPEGLNVGVKMSISGIPGAGLSDFQGRLNFDANVAQVSRVTGLNGYTVFASALDNQAGEVRFVVAKTSAPFLQQGEVLEFSFTPVGSVNASTALSLSLTTFNDSNGVFIPHSVSNGRLTIVVREPLNADFTFSPQSPIIDQAVQFTDTTQPSQGAVIEQWSWNFGDGTTSLEQNPTHVFTQPGTFTVELTVTDNFNRSNTTAKQVTVLESEPTEAGTVVVHAFPQPAKTQVTIVYRIPNGSAQAKLFVFSSTGKRVYQNDSLDVNSGRFTWNLFGSNDQPVPNGAYFYVVVALNSNGQGLGSATGKLIVQR